MFDLTGRRFLVGYRSDNEQLLALYNAGVRVSRELQLQPGIALSATQVAALTSDIIWLQQESVTLADGSVYQVLVPRVYLTKLKDRDLQPNGSLIAGGDVAIYAANDIKVQGSIAAEQNVSIAAANYLQRAGKLQGTTINLATVQDIRLQGGKVIGQDITIAAGTHLDISRTASGSAVNGSLDSFRIGREHIKHIIMCYT